MIVEITGLDIHTAERVVEALEDVNYHVEIIKCNNGLYRIGFSSLHDKQYKIAPKTRYSCAKPEGWFISGIVHGVQIARRYYKGAGMTDTFMYQDVDQFTKENMLLPDHQEGDR